MHDIFKMTYKNGETLYGNCWTIEEPKANVIILTGMLEHSLRYEYFATKLNEAGYNVYCIDFYGAGENVKQGGQQYTVVPPSAFSTFVKHTDELVSKLRVSCKPTFIFAHSMGSFMLQDYIQRFTMHVNKVVICGSCGKQFGPGLGYFLGKMMVNKKNRTKPNKFLYNLILGGSNKRTEKRTDCDWLSYNKENVDKYIADPLCGGIPSGSHTLEFLKGLKRIHKPKFMRKIRKDISILLVAGSEDPVGKYGKGVTKLLKMYKRLGVKDVNAIIYPHMRHEILNEDDKDLVIKDIIAFLDEEHVAADPAVVK